MDKKLKWCENTRLRKPAPTQAYRKLAMRAAIPYSLIGTAKLNGLDPERYLGEVLARIADHPINRIEDVLRWNLASRVASANQPAA